VININMTAMFSKGKGGVYKRGITGRQKNQYQRKERKREKKKKNRMRGGYLCGIAGRLHLTERGGEERS